MKNSKEYSKKIATLYQSLKRKYGSRKSIDLSRLASGTSGEPHKVVDSLIFGIISDKLNEKDTESAIKRFREYFVDWNDLRVSRIEEIAEKLGSDSPENREIALSITKVFNRIYNENHQVSLEGLHKLGKRPARQKLEKMEELSRFAIDYCMLTALDSHAIPLTGKMIGYLKKNELVDTQADAETIEGFLAKQISAKNGYEFYSLLRHESEIEDIESAVSSKRTTGGRTRKTKIKTIKKAKKVATATKKTKRKK